MKNKKIILSSILSLVLCLSLIAGGTFALFTSEAKTNIAVTSGEVKLTAEVKDLKMYSLQDIDTTTFKGTKVLCQETFLTGGTAKYSPDNGTLTLNKIVPGDSVEFKIEVKNESNVAIQYRTKIVAEANPLVVTINGEVGVRTDWAYKEARETIDDIFVTIELPASVEDWMNTEVKFDIVVEAIQGNALVYNTVEAEGQTGLEAAIAGSTAPTIVELPAGEYTVPTMNDKDITIVGTKDTVIDMSNAVAVSDSTVTFDGVTLVYDNDAYEGLQHSAKEVYKNCTIKGTMFLYAPEVEFINCTFEMYNETTEYSVWTYGATDVSFENCIFDTHGKAVLVYNEETESNFVADIEANNCVFVSDGTVATNKAAIETGSNANNTATSNKYYITVTDCIIAGFASNNSNSPAYGNKDNMDTDHLVVDATGITVADGYAYDDLSLRKAVTRLNSDSTVATIYLSEGTFDAFNLPAGTKLNLIGATDADGNPATIISMPAAPTDLNSYTQPSTWLGFSGLAKNMKFVASVDSGLLVLMSGDWNLSADATFENCTFENVGVKLVGSAQFTGCTFDGQGKAEKALNYGVVGQGETVRYDDCVIKNYTDCGINIAESAGSLVVKQCTLQNTGEYGISVGAIGTVTITQSNLKCNVSYYKSLITTFTCDAGQLADGYEITKK